MPRQIMESFDMRKIAIVGAAAVLALCAPFTASAFDPGNTSRIKTLVDTGMQYYWSGGDVKKAEAEVFKGITLHGRYDVVEKAFAEASSLAPERLDFRFAVASSQILQKNFAGARATYEDILARDPASFDAQAWLSALARIEGNQTQANPSARIMVTGGQPQAGVTEGDVMTKWLVDKGIDRDRILIEDKSKDTVGNVLNVADLLKRHTADAVILVTSASHMRRARTLLEDAFRQYDLSAQIVPVVALDAPSVEEAAKVSKDERMVVYRDLMRVSGLWAYPGLQ